MKLDIPGIGGSLGECVLCGKSFLKEIMLNHSVAMIHLDGFDSELPIHKETCLPALEKNGPDWKSLPDGPLRREFAKHFDNAVQP